MIDRSRVKVDVCFSCLAAKMTRSDVIHSAVLYEICSALTKNKFNIPTYALLSNIKDPCIVQRACMIIGFTADDHGFNARKVVSKIYALQKRLSRDEPMLYRKRTEQRELFISVFLIFNRAADDDVIVAAVPIGGDAIRKAFDTLCEKKKTAIRPLFNHCPAFIPPCIAFFNQKIGGKTNINKAGFHLVRPAAERFDRF